MLCKMKVDDLNHVTDAVWKTYHDHMIAITLRMTLKVKTRPTDPWFKDVTVIFFHHLRLLVVNLQVKDQNIRR